MHRRGKFSVSSVYDKQLLNAEGNGWEEGGKDIEFKLLRES